jgi:urease subunit gamma/beta
VHLSPTERDRLLLFNAAQLARVRRQRGLLLNVPEATAIVADTVAEAARDGLRLAEAIARGREVLGADEVLPGVADVVRQVEVEAVFADGTRLAVVPEPFGPAGGSVESPGAVLPAQPAAAAIDDTDQAHLTVVNKSLVPISVTSHFHFFEVNPRLRFDRAAAWGTRLAIPAGSVQRFDPGVPTEVAVVPIGGDRVVIGFAGLVDGPLDAPGAREQALEQARGCGYLDASAAAGAGPGTGLPDTGEDG